ncbi:MAG TPA: GNAT family N-acetyltransferase [Gemmatimonadaceae bacterium]|nr:GNAT family N-acetyltransferase [Gemmatimonadaceae bacterium]
MPVNNSPRDSESGRVSDPAIRALTVEDLADAFALSTTAGWNQQLNDWRLLLRIGHAGAFAAVIDGRVVGTAIGIDYGGFAWIAMMLVDPRYRGRGLGRRLLETAMHSLPPARRIRLDATPLGRPLYERYGFEVEATLSRHVSDGSNRGIAPAPDACGDVQPLTAADLDTVIEQDQRTFGGTRGAVVEWAFHAAPRYAYTVRGETGVVQYCLGREGRLFDQIGPVVAGDGRAASALVAAALNAAGNRRVGVDVFDSHTAFPAWLQQRGFVVERPLIRMCRAAQSAAPRNRGGESAPDSDRRGNEFAIFGPEFG